MVVELVYETHSISVDNERGIATGWLPGELSAEGRRLAQALGERRRNDGIVCVFTSDLRRAVETAAIAFEGCDIEIRQDGRLRECNYDELNGASVGDLEPRRRFVDHPYPDGESYRECVEEMQSFLGDVAREFDGSRVLVIAHSAQRVGAAPPAGRNTARGARRRAVRVAGRMEVRRAVGRRIASRRAVFRFGC